MIYITRTQKSIFAAAVLVLVIISGTIYIRQEKATEIELGQAIELNAAPSPAVAEAQAEIEPAEISVYICGNVKSPGVVKVKEGTRLDEAIAMVGGAGENADLTAVNLAYKLADEDMIYIPAKGEGIQGTSKAIPGVNTIKSVAVKSGKININSADQSELETLDGIGPATAKAIIQYRNQNGPFKSIEEIKNVSGIGDNKFNNIKDDITAE